MAFTPMTQSSPEPSWQRMWHGFKPQAQTLHWYLEMRQECRTFKSVTSNACEWLLLDLLMRARGASLTKTNTRIDEW